MTGQTNPANAASGATYGWVGRHQKLTETEFSLAFTQMGARVYLPLLGRFIQVDPIEGGAANSYVYPADPINMNDLTGECVFVLAILCGAAAAAVAGAVARVVVTSAVSIVVRVTSAPATRVVINNVGNSSATRVVVNNAPRVAQATGPTLKVVNNAQAAKNIAGTYQFQATGGQIYSGMSTRNIAARIQAHTQSGLYGPGTPITIQNMNGAGRMDIRIAEQNLINLQGGIGNPNVANKINSIAQRYWDDWGLQ